MGLPGIEAGKSITVKGLKGRKNLLRLMPDTRNKKRYYASAGWGPFLTSNKLSVGDKCVIKYITSEDKLCLTKVIRKNSVGVELETEDEDENGTDYEDDDDGDPFAKFTITKARIWRIPDEFMGLPGIEAGKNITVKDLNGIEHTMCLLLDPMYKYTERYHLSAGWVGLLRSNKLSVGDICVIKFIRTQGILRLTKVIKKKRPPCEISGAQVVKKRKTRQTQARVEIPVTAGGI
ncbi:uncharacterized protein [Rutidosis leptorrhynchoides]|uniref:uncharacterized protein n=1 Tax=Rutidosis leptorrhynchoides TaxID=125765 RepID=UPI003A991553